MNEANGKSSTGLDENIAALLCYAFSFVSGIIFFIIEKDSKFVRFHAMQSIMTFISLNIINWLLRGIPFIGNFLTWIFGIFQFAVWIYLMYNAYQKKWYKVPVIGDIAEKQVNI